MGKPTWHSSCQRASTFRCGRDLLASWYGDRSSGGPGSASYLSTSGGGAGEVSDEGRQLGDEAPPLARIAGGCWVHSRSGNPAWDPVPAGSRRFFDQLTVTMHGGVPRACHRTLADLRRALRIGTEIDEADLLKGPETRCWDHHATSYRSRSTACGCRVAQPVRSQWGRRLARRRRGPARLRPCVPTLSEGPAPAVESQRVMYELSVSDGLASTCIDQFN